MEKYIKALEDYANSQLPNDGEAILSLLYETWNEHTGMDNDQIKSDFAELYRFMNGMILREMDQILYPVCTLCRNHAKAGFAEGIKVGIKLAIEEGIG